ncbi:unnamed protein product [Colias eurytheme]|nr:unnamed protein product [Colias eurytheme]
MGHNWLSLHLVTENGSFLFPGLKGLPDIGVPGSVFPGSFQLMSINEFLLSHIAGVLARCQLRCVVIPPSDGRTHTVASGVDALTPCRARWTQQEENRSQPNK